MVSDLHVEGRRHKSALDLSLSRVAGLGGAESGLDRIDALVGEAGDLDIGTNLGRLGSETLADIGLELVSDGLAGEGDVLPNVGIAAINKLEIDTLDAEFRSIDIRNGKLESVERVAVFLVERPAYRLVELLDGYKGLLRNVSHDRVNNLALVVSLLAANNIFWRNTTLRQINIALLLVDTQNDDNFVATDPDKLLNGSDTTSG